MRYKIGRDPADYKAEMLEARSKPPALPAYAVQTVDGLDIRPSRLGGPPAALGPGPFGAPCGPCASRAGLRGLGAAEGTSGARWFAYGALAFGAVFAGMILFQKR